LNDFFKKIKNLVESSEQQNNRLKLLFRPDRWKYVKKLETDTECVFCRASRLNPSFETLVVYKSQMSCILLNKYPYNSGHLLVIPQRHEGNLLNLTNVEYEDLHQTLRVAVEACKSVYQPHGMNIGLNMDKAAGAGLPDHLHYHVIPRFKGDLNFFPLIADTKVIPESLEDCYNKMKNYFSSKGKS
jgi:ATP adenylyltransferase